MFKSILPSILRRKYPSCYWTTCCRSVRRHYHGRSAHCLHSVGVRHEGASEPVTARHCTRCNTLWRPRHSVSVCLSSWSRERKNKTGLNAAAMADSEFYDDVFDGIGEDELEQLERPSKRQKSAHPGDAGSEPDSHHVAVAERILADKFGYKTFRHEQAAAIQRILAGDNVLVVFPTGAGKSLCFQACTPPFPFAVRRCANSLAPRSQPLPSRSSIGLMARGRRRRRASPLSCRR